MKSCQTVILHIRVVNEIFIEHGEYTVKRIEKVVQSKSILFNSLQT